MIPTTAIITNGAIYQPTASKIPIPIISIIYPFLIVHLSTYRIGGLPPSNTIPGLGYTLPLSLNRLGLYNSSHSLFVTLSAISYINGSISRPSSEELIMSMIASICESLSDSHAKSLCSGLSRSFT